jgi:hypothetical protein
MTSASPSETAAEFDADVRELGEVLSDIRFQDRFHGERVDAQFGRP